MLLVGGWDMVEERCYEAHTRRRNREKAVHVLAL